MKKETNLHESSLILADKLEQPAGSGPKNASYLTAIWHLAGHEKIYIFRSDDLLLVQYPALRI